MQYDRHIAASLDRALATFRVVAVSGARQVGKTTLLRSHRSLESGAFLSFDRSDLVERAHDSPFDLIESATPPVVLDEFQRGGDDLLLAVKYRVDRNTGRGQFVLAGSSNFLTNRTLSETLAGRVGIVEVLTLSIGEIVGRRERFIDAVFDGGAVAIRDMQADGLDRRRLVDLVHRGGYPEVVQLPADSRRDFFDAYVTTIVGRESLDDVGAAQTRTDLRRLLALCAARTAAEFHPVEVGRDAQLARQTVAGLVEVLSTLGLTRLLPAWSTNATTRAKRAPKLVLNDTGLASTLLGQSVTALGRPDNAWIGPLVETFVANELTKAATWSQTRPRLHHFRDREGHEVDLVMEAGDGRIVAIEVKAATRVGPRAFGHLDYLARRLGDRFVAGIVLHGGTETWRHADRQWAAPISALWA